jgi:hypothetical protein
MAVYAEVNHCIGKKYLMPEIWEGPSEEVAKISGLPLFTSKKRTARYGASRFI